MCGPQATPGYWIRPDETAKVFTQDDWLRTGDIGFMGERGYFEMTDRKKCMIVVSGFNVFPNQIEDVLALHPGIAEVAVVGEPEEGSGEIERVVAVPHVQTQTNSQPELHAHVP